MILFASLVLLGAYAAFSGRRLLRYLHIFQQEEYSPYPFLKWIFVTRTFDKRLSGALVLLSALILWGLPERLTFLGHFLLALAFGTACFLERDPRLEAKKKLVMTRRAQRIYGVALCVSVMFGIGALREQQPLLWIVIVQSIPLALVAGNYALMPFETFIQAGIRKEASDHLKHIHPTVIGITGSFGKTSVKHMLGHILEMNAPTLFTPGSVNTLMGISRIIREKLSAGTRYFIVEMGAYGTGSIEKLCRLTPPHMGIITALGEAHYERFKTLDAVARAKFELAEAVLAEGSGKIVIHEDVLAEPYARDFVNHKRQNFMVCGPGSQADLKIEEIIQTTTGLTVRVQWQGQELTLFAPLFGTHHAGNMALAFAAALTLGVSVERAGAALRTVPQIKHRLEVKPQSDGTIYIDDGFNSNPRGFASALELLTLLAGDKGRRRILITPGIVELGAKHDEVHKALGIKAAENVDVALIIRGDRIPTFVDGYRTSSGKIPAHLIANLAEGLAWLKENGKAGDIILIENDLPDTGEAKLVL